MTNVCLCRQPKTGPRRCRDPRVAEAGTVYCGTTADLHDLIADQVVNEKAPGEVEASVVVGAMRSAGWRVDPPRRRRA